MVSASESSPAAPALSRSEFPVVGIGASAGGLKAFQELLSHLPPSPGLAFVLVPHLDPKQESLLHEILRRSIALPVKEAEDGTRIELDHIYVVKPNTSLTLTDGHLKTDALTRGPLGANNCIDVFLTSLAQRCGEKAIGIILSGSATDGAAGIRAIKSEGGITFAQDDSAEFKSMPQAACQTGSVDYVMPPAEIARELARIARHPFILSPEQLPDAAAELQADEQSFREILGLLEAKTGVPFLSYKSSTLERRILRRMALRQVESLADYQRYLTENPQEIRLLHDEVLVNFTTFFRDPETFDALKAVVYPELVASRSPRSPLRLWVPGCSTGEEAYSLAISLIEFLDEQGSNLPVQLFASDVSEPSINRARTGYYPKTIVADVSADRLRRFFSPADAGGYQISKRIRDLVLFARQDMTQDPPFSRLDILSCRNVLIYLGTALHKRVLPLFHYALRPEGFLLLGPSETADRFPSLFHPIDTKHRIYRKVAGSRVAPELPLERYRAVVEDSGLTNAQRPAPLFDPARAVDRALLA
ncbi:MAG TPA: chemotaxis protein CheB, partial [Planctomycetota bacterium]|nr:chemotaxis protein CheB [Planctomycetota bacterium]